MFCLVAKKILSIATPLKKLSYAVSKSRNFYLSCLVSSGALLPLNVNGQDLNDPKYIEKLKKKAPLQLINYKQDIVPILDKHCSNCHNPDDDAGGIDFEDLFDPKKALQHPDLWSMVGKTAKMDVMPPPKKRKRPTAKERELLISWGMQIEHLWDEGKMGKKPGRARLRRLNKNEYNNTIRDLFKIRIRPADNFPEDSAGEGGFDNDADALFLPSLLMENYLEAAVIISDAILNDPNKRRTFMLRTTSDLKGAKKVFSYWAPYIYRNKVEEAEINRIVATYKAARAKGKNHIKSMRDGLNMMLISPRFLYRIELPVKGGGKTVKVNDYELANRLSYFLWSSMPDAELFKLAAKNQLSDPKILEAQVNRMLKDDRAKTLARHLGGQWLGWDALRGGANPDAKKFPSFVFDLRVDMYRESSSFFSYLVSENKSIFELLDSDYTFLNERLAKFYNIPGVEGREFRKVKLNNPQRGGVLGMGSVLVASSMPLRTSPSLRGAYILETLLGDKPPSPPMDVEQLPANDQELKTKTIRETLELHRTSPDCRACHALIDPLGFGLENFDAIGRWRTTQNGGTIDSSGETPEGEKFTNPAELKKLLMGRKEQFARQATQKFLSFALGRELTPYDRPITKKITDEVMANDGKIQTLIMQIINSEPFLHRQNTSQ